MNAWQALVGLDGPLAVRPYVAERRAGTPSSRTGFVIVAGATGFLVGAVDEASALTRSASSFLVLATAGVHIAWLPDRRSSAMTVEIPTIDDLRREPPDLGLSRLGTIIWVALEMPLTAMTLLRSTPLRDRADPGRSEWLVTAPDPGKPLADVSPPTREASGGPLVTSQFRVRPRSDRRR